MHSTKGYLAAEAGEDGADPPLPLFSQLYREAFSSSKHHATLNEGRVRHSLHGPSRGPSLGTLSDSAPAADGTGMRQSFMASDPPYNAHTDVSLPLSSRSTASRTNLRAHTRQDSAFDRRLSSTGSTGTWKNQTNNERLVYSARQDEADKYKSLYELKVSQILSLVALSPFQSTFAGQGRSAEG